jgi:glycosyltransferase involved in cell wall biosynthesis
VTVTTGRRVALVHDWLTGMRGGEKVLDAICEIFPDAPLTTLVRVPGSVSPRIEARPIRTSFVQALPDPARFYRHYLPLYPLAVRLLDFSNFDLVVSSSHCAVKSVIVPDRAVHVCYCHSPMRYGWDQFDEYFGPARVGRVTSRLMRPVMRRMARWDQATADRVDRFLANSQYVAGRIRRYYNRGSTIVYPPVDTDFYTPESRVESPAFLIVSALVPYKRLDVAIDACRRVGVPLRIVGTGPERERLESRAAGGVEFLGWQSNEQIRELYRSSRATLLPGTEDFGIVPVESQACGTPVVALNAGGARETVVEGETGVLVDGTSVDAFAAGLERALNMTFDRTTVRRNAERFSRANFLASFTRAVEQAIGDKAKGGNADAARWGPRTPPVFPKTWPPGPDDTLAALPQAGFRTDTGNKDRDAAGRSPGSPRVSASGSPEPPLVDSDAARMPAASPRDSSTAQLETPLVDFDAARMPQASVPADRENKQ